MEEEPYLRRSLWEGQGDAQYRARCAISMASKLGRSGPKPRWPRFLAALQLPFIRYSLNGLNDQKRKADIANRLPV